MLEYRKFIIPYMKKFYYFKIYLCLLTIILLASVFYLSVSSYLVRAEQDSLIEERDSWMADDTILNFNEAYTFPREVIVIPVSKLNSSDNSQQYIQELYYYFATRSGIGDFPFHYIVTWDGSVYEGNKFGDEAIISFTNTQDAIFIAYIQDDVKKLGVSSVSNLKSIILKVINQYRINPDNISVQALTYESDEKGKLEKIELGNATNEWVEYMALLIEGIRTNYEPLELIFKAEVTEVTLPSENQEATGTAEIKIKVKNNGNVNLYSEPSSNIFIAKNAPLDSNSLFYYGEDWVSNSRIPLIKEGERLVIGEEKEFSFRVLVPIYPPEYSEDFVLVDPDGNAIAETEFQITLKINKPEATVIEIQETPIGHLNIREQPGVSNVVSQVYPGERFIVKDYQNGYYQIEANGKVGWVVFSYVKEISFN